jgi:hypothetical protein
MKCSVGKADEGFYKVAKRRLGLSAFSADKQGIFELAIRQLSISWSLCLLR